MQTKEQELTLAAGRHRKRGSLFATMALFCGLMLLVCGIYYPVSMLPQWVSLFAELIPVTYFLEYYRSYFGFQPCFPSALAKGYGLALFFLALEIVLLRVALVRAKRKGLLLKLSE